MKRKAVVQKAPKQAKMARTASVVLVPKRGLRTEERKNLDVLTTGTITFNQTTSNLFLLNGCDDGALPTQRVGRRITMTSMELRWAGSFVATTAGASPLRMCVVYDRQANGAAPTAVDVFAVDQITGVMNLGNSRRFKVLVDEIVENVSTAGPNSWYSKCWRDFTAKGTKAGLEVEFNDNSTATITSIVTGSIYAFFWQNGNILTASPTATLLSRIRFLDN